VHDHETCEQLMAAANRSGNHGRAEYLAMRCDRAHGQLTDPRASAARAAITPEPESAAVAAEEAS
jgi:hypothetical protein